MARTATEGVEGVDAGFPAALAAWIVRDGVLLDALLRLRRLGGEGAEALRAVLTIRRVATLRASWELWEALVEGDGDDPETLLLRTLSLSMVENARQALWGSSWRDAEEAESHSARAARLPIAAPR